MSKYMQFFLHATVWYWKDVILLSFRSPFKTLTKRFKHLSSGRIVQWISLDSRYSTTLLSNLIYNKIIIFLLFENDQIVALIARLIFL